MLRTLFCFAILFTTSNASRAAEPLHIKILEPQPNRVYQRVDFDPDVAAVVGHADVPIRFEPLKPAEGAVGEYRAIPLAPAGKLEVTWSRLEANGLARGVLAGWYRLEVRCRVGEVVTHAGTVEPFGVGEVFVVAGQSYATNCNDERLKVSDPANRVVAFDTAKGTWAVAHDPQPVPDGSDGGSIWPPVGDALLQEFRVPIAFANVAVGGTATSQWMPGEPLHKRLVETGKTLGHFRAVLWQQGESDVIAKTTTEKYVANLRAIRRTASAAWRTQPPWLLAKSTLHPTVYNDPAGEGRIRAAIDELTSRPGFQAGPDTDKLDGLNRGDAKSRRHFSALGQKNAAAMWVEVIAKTLKARRKLEETLPDVYLLSPAWASPMVYRESSVLLQMKPDGPIVARLGFPAAEIVEIAAASRRFDFDRSEATLSKDGLTLAFKVPDPIGAIQGRELFVPKGSPQSYSARVGHPEESLMYHPGRWFHDRNVEITYRRRDEKSMPGIEKIGTLPKTAARLKAGESFTLGISGDSISTGLDASALAKTAPYQPGYPDLVVAQLQSSFDCKIALKNRAVSGWSVANGVGDLDKLLAEKPHLVIVAYGMNDVGRRDPKWFGEQTQIILDRIKAADPTIEVVLVSSMLGNGEWTATPREMFPKYRDELKKLTGPGVALADVTAVWELLLRNKHDLDLTGNGLNHPNDFGHRLYAQAILASIQ